MDRSNIKVSLFKKYIEGNNLKQMLKVVKDVKKN